MMAILGYAIILIVILVLGAIVFHHYNPHAHVDWDTYGLLAVVGLIIAFLFQGFTGCMDTMSEEVRIEYLKRSQYAACLRMGNLQDECVKIVGSTGEED